LESTNVDVCGSHINICQGWWWLVQLTFFQCC
jgi:hypothetical protein